MEVEDAGDIEARPISAYAKLEFELFSFFIQTLTLIVGRKAKRDDNVDVHLGMSKSISRQHAKIYYQFGATSWEIEVLGKNGAFVNDRYLEAGCTCELKNTDRLQIADALFTFLLPEGSAPPVDPFALSDHLPFKDGPASGFETIAPGKMLRSINGMDVASSSPAPLAPHHLMQKAEVSVASLDALGVSEPISLAQIEMSVRDVENCPHTVGLIESQDTDDTGQDDTGRNSTKKMRKKYTRKSVAQKSDEASSTIVSLPTLEQARSEAGSSKPITIEADVTKRENSFEAEAAAAKAEAERHAQEEETAAQQAAQLLHQERLARQAQEEEEGLTLPPPETDPLVIASLQKPTASYATMIYNAISSHDKKKMTLAQIYSWICIYHPYYRYVQNGWQNSIRHNLSLNKAFKKVPRTDDEPGKGAFWAVDPDSEMLFEGGIYKKKPPRPPPTVPQSRGTPVVMKAGKLVLNPSFFVGTMQGKADEVLQALQEIIARQLGTQDRDDQTKLLSRVLALALAAQLKTATLDASSVRHLAQRNARFHGAASLATHQNLMKSSSHHKDSSNTPTSIGSRADRELDDGSIKLMAPGPRPEQSDSVLSLEQVNNSTTPSSSNPARIVVPLSCTTAGQQAHVQPSSRAPEASLIPSTQPASATKAINASAPVTRAPGSRGSSINTNRIPPYNISAAAINKPSWRPPVVPVVRRDSSHGSIEPDLGLSCPKPVSAIDKAILRPLSATSAPASQLPTSEVLKINHKRRAGDADIEDQNSGQKKFSKNEAASGEADIALT